MANITATTSFSNVSVTNTPSNITVTDDNNVTVTLSSSTTNVSVTSPNTTVTVAETASISNAAIRSSLSVEDAGYDHGSLSYSNANGVFTFVGIDNTSIRTLFSNTSPITYDSGTGVFGFEQTLDDLTLVKFQETVVDNGNVSANVSFDVSSGTIHKATLVDDITGITLSNISTGGGVLLVLQQDGVGGYDFDTTTHTSNWTDYKFSQNDKSLNTNASGFSLVSILFDGTNYFTSINEIDTADLIQNASLANSNVIVNGTTIDLGSSGNISHFGNLTTTNLTEGTNLYYTNARVRAAISASGNINFDSNTGVISESLTTTDITEGDNLYYTTDRANTAIGNYTGALTNLTGNITTTGVLSAGNSADQTHNLTGNLNVTGNVEVSGNLNYRNVEDLYVRDQSITLNANAATDATSSIIINRPVAGSNTVLRWNETSDIWEFTNDGSTYYPIPTSTSDLAEGTNLYYTDARANSAMDAYLSGGYGITYTGGVIETTNADIIATANGAFDTRLLDSSVTKLVNNIKIQDLAVSSDAANNVTSYYLPNTSPGSAGQYLISTSGTQLGFADFSDDANTAISEKLLDSSRKNAFDLRVQDLSVSSDAANGSLSYYFPNSSPGSAGQILLSTSGTQLGFSDFTDEANTAIGAYTGAIENLTGNVTTTGNITGGYIIAGNDAGGEGIFIGDINGAVQAEIWNASGGTLNKGDIVALNGAAHGDTPDAVLADSSNASLMPGFGVVKNNIGTNAVGEVVISGKMNYSSHGFTIGAQLYVDGTGTFTETRPTGEDQLVQKIATVTNSNTLNIAGASRTNDIYNVDQGKIILGSTSNVGITVTPDSNFVTTGNVFELANTLTDVNNIQSESGSNITLDTAGGTSINFTKTQGATADTLGISINPGGYGATIKSSDPTYSGTGNITTFVCRGNATSGSPNVVVSSAIELNAQSGGSTDFGNASTLSDFMSYASANMVFRAGGLYSYSLTPFPNGTRISSVDAANNIITMNNNALADFEYKDLTGQTFPWARTGRNQLLLVGQGAYDDDTGLIEHYYSEYDFGVSADRNTFIQDQDSWFPNFYNPVVPFLGGYGNTGPTVADITTSFGDEANLNIGQHAVIQRTKLLANSTFAELDHGLVFGGATPTRRMIEDVSDLNPIPGIQMLYSGNDVWNDQFINSSASGDWPSGIYSQPQLQLGLKQFTDNSAQNASPQIGPRIFFSSAKGKLSDSELTHYPRAGQEIGRITWWGTHGDDTAPAQNSPPAYMTVQASDDWTAGSNSSMYFTGTSNWQGLNTNDLWLAYERGNVILSSGQNSGDVSKNAGITFAPARAVGNNPKDIYDFSGNSATSLQQTFAKVNYANVSANSGAKVSVTHGASIGAGTVGDQVLSISRNDNSYSSVDTETSWHTWAPTSYFGSTGDTLRTNATSALPYGDLVTFSGVTDPNWTFLNGNSYVLRDEVFTGLIYTLYDSSNTTAITQAGGTNVTSPVGTASYNVSVTSGVTDYEYTFELPEQESNLYIKANATTAIKITDTTEVNFTNIPVLPSHSNTSLPSAGTAGGMIYITNGNDKPAYSNGSAWLYVFDNSAVT